MDGYTKILFNHLGSNKYINTLVTPSCLESYLLYCQYQTFYAFPPKVHNQLIRVFDMLYLTSSILNSQHMT